MITQQFERKVKEWIKNKGFELDIIDFNSLDKQGKDTYIQSIKDNYGIVVDFNKEKIPTKTEVLDNVEKEIEKEWLKERIETPITHTTYFQLEHFLTMVLKKHLYGVIVCSDTALGKTHYTLGLCERYKVDYAYISTKTTPLGLYIDLYENNHKDIIVLDDIESVLDSPDAVKILMACVWEIKKGKRILNYSTSKKMNVPKRFEFNPRVIMLLNNVNRNKINPLLSRVISIDFNPNFKQRISLLYALAEKPYKKLNNEERLEVLYFIEQNTNEAVENLNLRLLIKGYEFYLYNKEIWRQLLANEIKMNTEKALLLDMMEQNISISQQVDRYKEATGKSRRTYFRIKRELMK